MTTGVALETAAMEAARQQARSALIEDLKDVAQSCHRPLRYPEDNNRIQLVLLEAVGALLASEPDPRVGAMREALDRYRYAVAWVSADSWDFCNDCRSRLEWARALDERLTADQIAAIGKKYLVDEGRAALASPPRDGE